MKIMNAEDVWKHSYKCIVACCFLALSWGHLIWINQTQVDSVYGHLIAIPLLMLLTGAVLPMMFCGKKQQR